MSLKGLEHTGQQSIRYRRALKNCESMLQSLWGFSFITWVALFIFGLWFIWNYSYLLQRPECIEENANIGTHLYLIAESVFFAAWYFSGGLLRDVRKEIATAEQPEENHG